MVPTTLSEWTLPVLRALLEQGVFETDRFDFKEMLPDSRDESGKRRLRHAVAAFANSQGGFLVFGIRDSRTAPPEDRMVGLPAAFDLPARFGDQAAACIPTVEWQPLPVGLRLPAGNLIHVVQIAASSRRPHALEEEGRLVFPKRTNRGTEFMSYDEVRDAFREGARRRRTFAVLRSELERLEALAKRINLKADHLQTGEPYAAQSTPWLERYDASTLEHAMFAVFEECSRDAILVDNLNTLRAETKRFDREADQFARLGMRYRGGLAGFLRLASSTAFRVIHASHHALTGLSHMAF